MALYSLFVLKVPLNRKQTNKCMFPKSVLIVLSEIKQCQCVLKCLILLVSAHHVLDKNRKGVVTVEEHQLCKQNMLKSELQRTLRVIGNDKVLLSTCDFPSL